MKSNLLLYLKGVAMGAADIVPGVSGGTVALITGIYEELLFSIKNINIELFNTLLKKGIKEFWKQLNGNFLSVLLMGISSSIILLAQLIVFLLDNHQFKLWGLFFGLIIASAFLILKDIQTMNIKVMFLMILGTAIAVVISLSNTTTFPNSNIYIFLTGSIAITAMILPGVSGSFILLLFSKYEYIINSIKDFDIRVIFVFGTGCIFGLLLFSRFLHFLFQNYKDNLLALLTGFLFGSLIKIWPFRKILKTRINSDGIEEAVITKPLIPTYQEIDSIVMFLSFAIIGYVLITFIQKKSIS